MLILDRVSFSYGNKPVLTSVTLTLPDKGTFCFTGPSGCGKTTLFRLIAGLQRPHTGVLRYPEHSRIATVFQENRLLPWLTVEENIRCVGGEHHEQTPDILHTLKLDNVSQAYPASLSGGMQRRVALARAMAYGGNILLLDEPFNGLDADLRRVAADAINAIFDNTLILMISHTESEPALMNAEIIPFSSLNKPHPPV